MRVGTSCRSCITAGTDYNFEVLRPRRRVGRHVNCSLFAAMTTLGFRLSRYRVNPAHRWTTSLGITLAQPHAADRASPILAGTGSFSLTRQGISLDAFAPFDPMEPEASLYLPACRHADRTISSPANAGVWRMASEDSARGEQSFLLIVRTRRIVTASAGSSAGFSEFPAYSQILLRQQFLP